jgi:hypothetical protein
MLPPSAWWIAASVGVRSAASSATTDITMPGVQYPHCSDRASTNAACTAWRCPSRANPSTVATALPSSVSRSTMQARTATPSQSTVHAPHCPSPHPYLAPVRRRSSRSASSSVRPDGSSSVCSVPLIMSRTTGHASPAVPVPVGLWVLGPCPGPGRLIPADWNRLRQGSRRCTHQPAWADRVPQAKRLDAGLPDHDPCVCRV